MNFITEILKNELSKLRKDYLTFKKARDLPGMGGSFVGVTQTIPANVYTPIKNGSDNIGFVAQRTGLVRVFGTIPLTGMTAAERNIMVRWSQHGDYDKGTRLKYLSITPSFQTKETIHFDKIVSVNEGDKIEFYIFVGISSGIITANWGHIQWEYIE